MKAIKVGIIPYDWVIDINLKGDDTNGSALIYCYFRKKSNWKFERRVKLNKEGNMYRTKWHCPQFCVNRKLQDSGFILESCFQI